MIEGTGVRESQRSLQSGFRHSKRLRPDFPCKDDLWLVGLHNPQAATLTIRTRESAGSIVPLVLRMYGVAVSTRLGLKKKNWGTEISKPPPKFFLQYGLSNGLLDAVLRTPSILCRLRTKVDNWTNPHHSPIAISSAPLQSEFYQTIVSRFPESLNAGMRL